MGAARAALLTTMTQLVARNGSNSVACGGLKLFIKRLLPAFDERSLGLSSFSDFLAGCSDIVEIVDTNSGGHVALVNAPASRMSENPATAADPLAP